jgi:formylglycine-generating enzyme required for sulfatase activity
MTEQSTQARGQVVEVPGAHFVMGSATLVESDVANPPHPVTLSPYAIGAFPVTNADYRGFVDATGAAAPASWQIERFAGPHLPVTGVSWDDALAYCTWAGGTLPTEAQWELAARGIEGRTYPWGEEEPDEPLAHFAQDWNAGGPCDVGAHPAGKSPLGCHDLAGNVWEWCLDGFQISAHVAREGRLDPVVSAESNVRPLRGGCWRSIAPKLQASYRNWSHRAVRHVTIGFRMCFRAGSHRLTGAREDW